MVDTLRTVPAVLDGIIDMRLRPRWLHPFFGALSAGPEFEVVRWLGERVGSHEPDHFQRATDMSTLTAEMDEARIAIGVIVGRSTPTVRVRNEDVANLAANSDGRLVGVASVDPVQLGAADALLELRRAVSELGLRAVNFDAGFYATPLRPDADLLLPLYEECRRLGVPAFVMSGPTTPDLAFNDPLAVDNVARTFPDLRIVCCHGFYPRVADMVAVAFRRENVFVSPDMYMFCPGAGLYVEAARGFMRDQCLFGSSYPFRPLRQSVQDLMRCDLDAETLARITRGTPRRLLSLTS